MRWLLFKYCFVFALIFFFTNCKTYQKVDWVKPLLPKEERSISFELRQLSRIQQGDSILVITRNSTKYYLIYSLSENDSIQGLFWKYGNQRIQFPVNSGFAVSELKELKVRKFDLGTTLKVAIGIPLTAIAIIGSVNLYQNIPEINDIFDAN